MQVVCGIIIQEDRYLIARRGNGVDAGFWEFPGGKVEADETKEEAVIRELKEELALDVEVLYHLADVLDTHHKEDIYVSAYVCRIKAGELILHVHDEALWVCAEDLFRYAFQEADMPILEKLNHTYKK